MESSSSKCFPKISKNYGSSWNTSGRKQLKRKPRTKRLPRKNPERKNRKPTRLAPVFPFLSAVLKRLRLPHAPHDGMSQAFHHSDIAFIEIKRRRRKHHQ